MSEPEPKASRDAFNRKSGRIGTIEASMKSDIVCSNHNRVAILHLLGRSPRKGLQAEKLAKTVGVSHRTVLYHLDILEDYDLVQVRGFRRKGKKMLRSVWGLNTENEQLERVMKIICRKFPPEKVRKIIKSNGYANGYAR